MLMCSVTLSLLLSFALSPIFLLFSPGILLSVSPSDSKAYASFALSDYLQPSLPVNSVSGADDGQCPYSSFLLPCLSNSTASLFL